MDDSVHSGLVALRDLVLAAERFRQTVSDHLGVSANETVAIAYLYGRNDVGQTELAHILNITTSSTTTLIDRLEQNKLAERIPHPLDRRRSSVRLTDFGRSVLEQSREWFSHAFDHIDATVLPTVTTALNAMAADLRDETSRIHALSVPGPDVAVTEP